MLKLHKDKSRNGAYNHVLRYTGLFGGVQGFSMFMSFVRNKFVAVLLGSTGIGLIDLYNRTMSFITAFFTLIAPVASVRSLSVVKENGTTEDLNEKIKVIRSWTLLTAIIGFLLCVVFSPLISKMTFGNYDQTSNYLFLAPIIPLVAISGTEISILKAVRELRRLAWSSFYGAISLATLSIPFYLIMGSKGIVPALLLSTFSVTVIQLLYTLPLYPWHCSPFSLKILKKGKDFIHLSILYILAGIIASGSELFVRSFIVKAGNVSDVGLYTSGFILTVTAARFLFVAMDADFFPRLSAYCNQKGKMNLIVNRQLEVCVLLVAPFLIVFNLFLPYIIQLLFSQTFMEVVPMATMASFYMFFKAASTPIAYLSLAKGDGKMYFAMETTYYVFFTLLIIFFYHKWGITGTGIALSLSNIIEFTYISIAYHWRYKFVFSRNAIKITLLQGIFVLGGIYLALNVSSTVKYLCGIPLFLISLIFSLRILSRRSSLHAILNIKKNNK